MHFLQEMLILLLYLLSACFFSSSMLHRCRCIMIFEWKQEHRFVNTSQRAFIPPLLIFAVLCFSETDLDQITRAEVTPARVSTESVLLTETRESRVGPSSSPGAKSPAGPSGTDRAPALLLLLLTETESIGTRWGLKMIYIITSFFINHRCHYCY